MDALHITLIILLLLLALAVRVIQSADCNGVGKCTQTETTTIPGYFDFATFTLIPDQTITTCIACTCPDGYSGTSCSDFTDPCTPNPCPSPKLCTMKSDLSYSCKCGVGFSGNNCNQDTACNDNLCANGANCTSDPSVPTYGYKCMCPTASNGVYSGQFCEKFSAVLSSSCPGGYCQNNAVCYENYNGILSQYSCACTNEFSYGDRCQKMHPCGSDVCEHGAICKVQGQLSDNRYSCQCLNIWAGDNCENFNACAVKDLCIHGSCESVGDNAFKCNCDLGYNGTYCDLEVNYCSPSPCGYNSTCTRKLGGYTCDCVEGATGVNCTDLIPHCEYQQVQSGWISLCTKVDPQAICNEVLNGYTCTCSPDFTDQDCSMRTIVWHAIQLLSSEEGLDRDSLIALLNDMIAKPSLIKDMVPFMLALMPESEQRLMSWSYDDIFEWVAYERTELTHNDFYQWYEPTLGSCFTFNSASGSKNYSLRYAGALPAFTARMAVRQDEYLSWVDTVGMNVFIHDSQETIFGESVRYIAEPGALSVLRIDKTSYKRLDGRYGVCVRDKSEVGSYYYDGQYTTDGCLRSCYQDAVFQECGCVDPRYPHDVGVEMCPLAKRNCVLNVTETRGDPSKWESCRCPAPCSEVQYRARYSNNGFSQFPCSELTNNADIVNCTRDSRDKLMIKVFFPRLSRKVFAEVPKMSFNQLISYTGGLLGVFVGVCIFTFVEFAYLFVRLFFACAGKECIRKD